MRTQLRQATPFVMLMGLAAVFSVSCAGPTTETPAAYAVELDPANFTDKIDHPFFPLAPGTTFTFEGNSGAGTERVEVTVSRETREILGIQAVVVRDRVTLDGELVEDTFDWYAQDKDGNVWYLGEDTKEYENGQVVSTQGSWEAGRDGALPGIIMNASPQIGTSYRQEYYQGEAEDMAEVVSRTESKTVPYGSFTDLLVTKEWTPLEPGVAEHKYYARGVGLIATQFVEGGSGGVELIDITTE